MKYCSPSGIPVKPIGQEKNMEKNSIFDIFALDIFALDIFALDKSIKILDIILGSF